MIYKVEVMVKEKWVKGEWYITTIEVEADSLEEASVLGVAKVKEANAKWGGTLNDSFSCWKVTPIAQRQEMALIPENAITHEEAMHALEHLEELEEKEWPDEPTFHVTLLRRYINKIETAAGKF